CSCSFLNLKMIDFEQGIYKKTQIWLLKPFFNFGTAIDSRSLNFFFINHEAYKYHFICLCTHFILGMGCEEVGNCERGRGPIVSKQLELPSFHSLKLSGSDKVIVTQGPQQEVWVEGEENIIDLIRLSVSNGEWDIRTRGCVGRHERLIYHVTLPEIKGLSLSGSGDIVGENTFLTSRIELEVTGSGSITADVDADDVEAEITGSGLLILSGSSQQ